jgi:Arc/MetJ-type ribon-helix-helix transcriptional regulator
MVTTVDIPSDLDSFIRREVALGAAGSEEELLIRALELYREMRQRHEELKARITQSLDDAKRGDVANLDIETTIARGIDRLTAEGFKD